MFGGPGKKWYYSLRHYRWLQAAQAALERGDLPTASWTSRRVLDRDPTNLKAVQLLARTKLREGSRDAIYWQSRVVELEPDEPANLLAWAKTAIEFHDLSTATIALGRIPESVRPTFDYAVVAAQIAAAQGDPDLAARHLDAAMSLAPDSPEIRFRLAIMQLQTHSEFVRSEGRATLDQLKAVPQWRREAYLALAQEALTKGRFSEALESTRELLMWGYEGRDEQLMRAEALNRAGAPEFGEYLKSIQAAAARSMDTNGNRLTPAHIVQWMGRNQLAADAILWAKTLPPETGKTRATALAVAQLYIKRSDWLALRAWTKDPTWNVDEPLRLALQALALARGPAELRPAGEMESLWTQASKMAAHDPARLEQIAVWTTEWELPVIAESAWWALADAADDPGLALDQLATLYRQRTDANGRYRVARRRVEFHPMDRMAIAELAYLTLLIDAAEPDSEPLIETLRRRPPLSTEAVRACALNLWRHDRAKEAVPLFETLTIASREEPSLAWFYGCILSAAGDTTKAAHYLALGANFPRCPEEEALYREARLRIIKR